MKRLLFTMYPARVAVDDDDADVGDIEMAIIEKLEGMLRAVREGGLDLGDIGEWYVAFQGTPVCPHCGGPVCRSTLADYVYVCPECDEDLYAFECETDPGAEEEDE